MIDDHYHCHCSIIMSVLYATVDAASLLPPNYTTAYYHMHTTTHTTTIAIAHPPSLALASARSASLAVTSRA